MLKADQRPTEVLTTEVVRGRKSVRPKTAGQKRYVDAVRDHTVTFAIGPAGTGKSYLAVALAVQALQAKAVNRIILTRPAVEAGERLGFLPGDMLAKVDPYLRPLYDALYDMLEPEVVARLMERGTIEVAPLAYMRGRTLNDSFIILDEAQNTTPEQMKMFLTRLGFGSKTVVTGDVTQIDLPDGPASVGPAAGARRPRRHRRPRVRASSARATSCATGSCRRSSTPTGATTTSREPNVKPGADQDRRDGSSGSRRSRSCRFGADEQRDVPVDVARWVRLAELVLDDERVIERLGADAEMSLLFVDSRRSPSSTNGSSAAAARPTCSRSRSTTSSRRRAANLIKVAGGPGRRPTPRIRRPCSATSSSARRSRAARRESATCPPRTSWRSSSSTACCTCSTTTMRNPNEGVVMRRREQELLARFREIEGRA